MKVIKHESSDVHALLKPRRLRTH